jgi:hypothetical protein
MKKIILSLVLILTYSITFSQVVGDYINPAAKLTVTNAVGSNPYTLTVSISDDLSRFTFDSISTGCRVYLIDGANLLTYTVNSKLTSPNRLVVTDINNTGNSPPTGQGAVVKLTNSNFPVYVSGLRDDLRSMIMNSLSQQLDTKIVDAKELYKYVGGIGIAPAVTASVAGTITAQNTVGQLWTWNPASNLTIGSWSLQSSSGAVDTSLYNSKTLTTAQLNLKANLSDTSTLANGIRATLVNKSSYIADTTGNFVKYYQSPTSILTGDSTQIALQKTGADIYKATLIVSPSGGLQTDSLLVINSTGVIKKKELNIFSYTDSLNTKLVGNNVKLDTSIYVPNQILYEGSMTAGKGLRKLQTGAIGNIGYGKYALFNNTNGHLNTAMGDSALYYNTIGNNNVALGGSTLTFNVDGYDNVAIGAGSLRSSTGTGNTAIGTSSGFLATGGLNLFAGNEAGMYGGIGSSNIYMGYQAGKFSSGSTNIGIGYNALMNSTVGGFNTALGYNALKSNTTGYHNIAIGEEALQGNTAAFYNLAIGTGALRSTTTGESNVAIGTSTLYNNITGNNNCALGSESLINNTANNNSAIGFQSLRNNTTGTNNTGVGFQSLFSASTAVENTAIGMYSLRSTTTGGYNMAQGSWSLWSNTTGTNNTSLGSHSGDGSTTGSYNTFLGWNSGNSNTTGDGNTYIGQGTGNGITTGTNNTIVGGGVSLGNVSNTLVLSAGGGNIKIYSNATGTGIGTINPQYKLDINPLTGNNPLRAQGMLQGLINDSVSVSNGGVFKMIALNQVGIGTGTNGTTTGLRVNRLSTSDITTAYPSGLTAGSMVYNSTLGVYQFGDASGSNKQVALVEDLFIKSSNAVINIPSITGMGTVGTVSVTVTGVVVGMQVSASPRTNVMTSGVSAPIVYVSAANTVTFSFSGLTVGTNGNISSNWDITVIK